MYTTKRNRRGAQMSISIAMRERRQAESNGSHDGRRDHEYNAAQTLRGQSPRWEANHMGWLKMDRWVTYERVGYFVVLRWLLENIDPSVRIYVQEQETYGVRGGNSHRSLHGISRNCNMGWETSWSLMLCNGGRSDVVGGAGYHMSFLILELVSIGTTSSLSELEMQRTTSQRALHGSLSNAEYINICFRTRTRQMSIRTYARKFESTWPEAVIRTQRERGGYYEAKEEVPAAEEGRERMVDHWW
ncbi:hypothetical protein GGX14DRAFT_405904 [Mycena pura]|uniref:Uncharacterized protein n=1 Tax=Mycena pura TaxID=153505 RepID=A0AAD6Y3S8_9AGAR|nr:hypothetical protein GGX14DRAFT_405904 [Mycena pura]